MTRGAGLRPRSAATLLLVGLALCAGLLAAGAVPAGASGSVSIAATVNGVVVANSSQSHPVTLNPDRPALVALRVRNDGTTAVNLRTVRIEGSVVGLSFFSYDTSVNLVIGGGSATSVRYTLDLSGLGGQATGLIPGSVQVLGPQRQVLASQSMVTDVKGSIVSVYGLFGLALLILTVLAVVDVLLAMARHRMPQNRWRRALRFMTPGIGIGLVVVFTLSALRVWVPSPGIWLTVVLIFAAAFFVIGYLSPTPVGEDEDDEDEEDEDLDAAGTGVQVGSPAPGGGTESGVGLGMPPS
ncbi:MAG TPA: hypothetical protein VMU09_09080 [Acidimicrobiales bacterium]|nr:hypothetical protein [Acidimicrobiales bacterium]